MPDRAHTRPPPRRASRAGTRARWIALAALLSVGDACAGGSGASATPAPDQSPVAVQVSRGSLKRRAARADAVPAFWTAIALVDADAAERSATTVEERLFAQGYRALIDGRGGDALVLFDALAAAGDDGVRAAARTGRTLVLEHEGRWSELAGPRRDSVFVGDRASIELWARSFASLPAPVFRAPPHAVDIPLKLSSVGTPVVAVKINGSDRVFWLDTGASLTMVSAAVARDLGIRAVSNDTLAVATWAGRVPARAALVDRFELGPVRIDHLPVAVLNEDVLQFDANDAQLGAPTGRANTVRLDGVIGTDVLRRLAVTIDLPARTLSVARPPAHGDRRDRNLFWLGFPVVKLATASGRPALFGLDTGADSTFVGETWFLVDTALKLSARRGTLVGLGATTMNTLQVTHEVLLSDDVFTVRLRNVAIAPERRTTFVTLDGVLGTDFIRAAQIHLDITNGVFAVRPTRPKPPDLNGPILFR